MTVTSDRARALRLVVLAILTFAIAIIVVVRYGAEIDKINWRLVSLMCGLGFAAYMIYEWNTNEQRYNFVDLFLTEGKVDLWKHLVVLSFALFAWAVVQQGLGDKGVATDLMLGGLGIFVGREGVALLSNAIQKRPAAAPSPIQVNAPAAPPAGPTLENPLPVQLVDGDGK
jgi:hypothetical protein